MPIDAYRRGEEFIVEFDLPGVEPDSIELTVERNVLSVHASRSRPTEGQEIELLIAERPQGTFSRQLFLGESLDADSIDANYSAGVLRLRIPVAERAKPRRLTVNVDQQEAVSVNSQEKTPIGA